MKLDNILQKSFLQLLFIITAIIPVLTSCNIEKRIYMPGANIEWKKRNQNSPKQELAINYNLKKEEQISSTLIPIKNPPFIERPSIEYAAINSLITKEKLNIGNINPKYPGCDTIFLKTGEQIKAKVLEVGQSEIKYKLCDNLNDPTFI